MAIHRVKHPAFYALAPGDSYLVEGECRAVMGSLPSGCADLIFADPPYNLRFKKSVERPDGSILEGVTDDWDQFDSPRDYDRFTLEWLTEARRVLKDHGTLWVMGMYHNLHRVGYLLQESGWWILNSIVWIKANPTPQFRGVRFCHAHEELLWVAKSEKLARKYTFNYQQMKEANGGKQMRSDWYFGICQGKERLKDEQGQKVHSTQKPIALLERVVLSSSKEGDLVLDPFAGVATTAAACARHGRRFFMIEREPRYLQAAQSRLDPDEA